nr:doublecortin domain-containing protein 2-like [Chelonoidis abingdonii]
MPRRHHTESRTTSKVLISGPFGPRGLITRAKVATIHRRTPSPPNIGHQSPRTGALDRNVYILFLHLLLAQWKLRDSDLQARILLSPEARQCVFWLEDCVPEERDVIAGPYFFLVVDEGIYKAGEKRSEMWGAAEIQEDEDTQVEVPVDQRPAETVDEEENEEEGDEGNMNGDQGEEMREAANGNVLHNEIEENEEKINEHYEEEQEEENLGQLEEEGPFRLNGETNEENGEEMEQFNDRNDLHPEKKTKAPEDFDNQSQIDSHLEKASNPRVTITSPQESEKNDQTNEYAAVA